MAEEEILIGYLNKNEENIIDFNISQFKFGNLCPG